MTGAEGAAAAVLVADDEQVCRLGFNADYPVFRENGVTRQYDPETGLLLLSEIALKDLTESGFSLQRHSLYTLEDGLEEAARRDEKKSKQRGMPVNYRLEGVHTADVGAIHGIKQVDGTGVFDVLATPRHPDDAHAEVRGKTGVSKAVLLKFRSELRNVLGPIRAIDSLRRRAV